ncbi:carboxypeptidase regulatory-like domain-containing protein [Candidatus Magnetobacterium casense]|uniref:Carboxypeptidase regulatory-like domain-containing protein n=1 Tax=Candidatus Magnetobacterium casense TaxID=1455061 RepID=A0ABS6RUA0_9BACT|nr:carboxypeptidase regulatory-like domain-containing protein [Candidatus Magnetobacterium casensis]MBV6340202.1 carboxypeptidase regulatory-like domain-containing protein [Candidatus Magnetobacterium casensis]
MKKVLLSALVIVLLLPAIVFADAKPYEVVNVTDGGSIKGKIKSSGPVKDTMAEIKKDENFCGKSVPKNEYIISAANEVKNVLVIVEDVEKGKAVPKTDTVIDNMKCEFLPVVAVAYVGGKYIIKNSDPIFHNTSLGILQGEGKKRTVYNLALPNKDQVIEKPVKTPGLQIVQCDAHSWMRSHVYASKTPYVAITNDKGDFEIKDLLPGKYKVKIWHEGFGETTKDVEVKAGQAATLDHTFTKK